jgi:hypothetical protein
VSGGPLERKSNESTKPKVHPHQLSTAHIKKTVAATFPQTEEMTDATSSIEDGVAQVPCITVLLETGERLKVHSFLIKGCPRQAISSKGFFTICNIWSQNWSTVAEVLSLEMILHLLTEFKIIPKTGAGPHTIVCQKTMKAYEIMDHKK